MRCVSAQRFCDVLRFLRSVFALRCVFAQRFCDMLRFFALRYVLARCL